MAPTVKGYIFHISIRSTMMNQCHSPPPKLYYFGPWSGSGLVKATNTHKLPDQDDSVVYMDFAKDHLKHGDANSPFISLFSSLAALKAFLKAHGRDHGLTARMVLCEVDVSKLNGVKLYQVKDIARDMGAFVAGKTPLPDFLAVHKLPCEAVIHLPLDRLR